MLQTALDRLVGLLDLEELEVDRFCAESPPEDRQRVLGGQRVASLAQEGLIRPLDRAS